MSEKKMSWADIADEEDALEVARAKQPPPLKWIPPHARDPKQKLKNLFSKEKNLK
jgi:hypothetical protein